MLIQMLVFRIQIIERATSMFAYGASGEENVRKLLDTYFCGISFSLSGKQNDHH